MQKTFFILAALLLWGGAAQAEQSFTMGGVSYSSCKAAEPYAYDSSGQLNPEYAEHCSDGTQALAANTDQGGSLSGAELNQLNRLQARRAVELLDERPANSYGYVGEVSAHKALPADDCTEQKVPDYQTRQVYVRVVCRHGRYNR